METKISYTAIYIMWLREMKRFVRAKSRVFGNLLMPVLFLIFMGYGFSNAKFSNISVNYIDFFVPGIVGMTMLFSSVFSGISVLWDKEFGFLKEIMVAPVSRLSLVLGRVAGGVTTALLQGISVLFASFLIGFRPRCVWGVGFALIFMILISITFIGLGLIFASNMSDMQGFSMITNFVIFPLFFLSGAFYPLENLPMIVRIFSYIDPLTYGIDALRETLTGVSKLPMIVNLSSLTFSAIVMLLIGVYFFERTEVD